jgi:CO/xanthine dehydrogenase Mo-binding subunit
MSTVKIGANKDGRIVAAEGTFYLQAGGLPGSPIRGATACSFAPYDIPNVHSLGYDVVCNRSKVAAYRAPGAPIGAFPVECVLDEVSEAIGMDPLELRLKNAAKEGTKAAHRPAYPRIGYAETVEAALAHPHREALLGKHQGRGVASGFWFNAGGESSAATIGFSNLTGGSRVLFASSMAVTKSTEKVIGTLRARAAKIWDIDRDAVTWEDGAAGPAGDNAGKFDPLTLEELAHRAPQTGGPIGAGAQLNTTGAEGGFATHICDVEVDVDLGIVRVLRYTSFQDVGRAIHPSYVEGQMQGGVAQGVGWALNEEYIYDKDGKVDNPGFLDYRMPVCSDLPMLDTVMIEIPNPKHPQGVRGVGEVPLVPPLAAIRNAVYDALGIRFYSLPMSPPKVSEALEVGAAAE